MKTSTIKPISLISLLFGVAESAVISKSRNTDSIYIRATLYYILKNFMEMGYVEIGREILINHTTIIKALKNYNSDRFFSVLFKHFYDQDIFIDPKKVGGQLKQRFLEYLNRPNII